MGGVSGMDYWHKRYTCPYFTSSEKRRVCCAGAWEHCTIARHLTDEYERKEEKNGKDAG